MSITFNIDSSPVNIILLTSVTIPTTGEYVLQGEKTISIEIYGTSTSRTIKFQAKGISGAVYDLTGVKTSNLSTGTQTTGTGEIWQFDVTGLYSFIVNLTTVNGGNVSVAGRAVA